jgi:ERCC4-related helicase
MISHVELRNEESPDIAVFTHKRSLETVVVSLGTYLSSVKERFMLVCCYCLVLYTGCPRRNVPDFGRVFLKL